MTWSSSWINCARLSSASRTPRLQRQVATPHLLVERHFLQHGQHALPDGAGQQIVEVFERPGAPAALAVFERPAGSGDVLPRIEEASRRYIAIHGAAQLFLQGAREQRVLRDGILVYQVVVQAEIVEVAIRLADDMRLNRGAGNVSSGWSRRSRPSARTAL